MTHLPPDPPLGSQPRKAPPESVLAAPRNPVTRWNRKYLIAGATGLAAIVALGFYLGFGGAHAPQARPEAMTDAADTGQVQTPAISTKYAAGYADPALQAQALPGTAALPPPEGSPAALAAGTPPPPPPPAQVDPAVQAAREQALAARTSGPFFGGPPPVAAAPASADLAALARPIAATAGGAGEPAAA